MIAFNVISILYNNSPLKEKWEGPKANMKLTLLIYFHRV